MNRLRRFLRIFRKPIPLIDIETHRHHAQSFVRYYTGLIADFGNVDDWQRGLEYALEYQAIVEQEPLDMERAQRLADALESFKHEGSGALDLYLHVRNGLTKLAVNITNANELT